MIERVCNRAGAQSDVDRFPALGCFRYGCENILLTLSSFPGAYLRRDFFAQELMQEILGTWDREALLVIVDHRGARSLDAAAYFAGHGFTNVMALRGGIDAWNCEVDPNLPRYELE